MYFSMLSVTRVDNVKVPLTDGQQCERHLASQQDHPPDSYPFSSLSCVTSHTALKHEISAGYCTSTTVEKRPYRRPWDMGPGSSGVSVLSGVAYWCGTADDPSRRGSKTLENEKNYLFGSSERAEGSDPECQPSVQSGAKRWDSGTSTNQRLGLLWDSGQPLRSFYSSIKRPLARLLALITLRRLSLCPRHCPH